MQGGIQQPTGDKWKHFALTSWWAACLPLGWGGFKKEEIRSDMSHCCWIHPVPTPVPPLSPRDMPPFLQGDKYSATLKSAGILLQSPPQTPGSPFKCPFIWCSSGITLIWCSSGLLESQWWKQNTLPLIHLGYRGGVTFGWQVYVVENSSEINWTKWKK